MVDELLAIEPRLMKRKLRLDNGTSELNTSSQVKEKVEELRYTGSDPDSRLNQTILGQRLRHKTKHTREMLSAHIYSQVDVMGLTRQFLHNGDEQAVKDLRELGANFIQLDFNSMSPVTLLAQLGYCSLLRDMVDGARRSEQERIEAATSHMTPLERLRYSSYMRKIDARGS